MVQPAIVLFVSLASANLRRPSISWSARIESHPPQSPLASSFCFPSQTVGNLYFIPAGFEIAQEPNLALGTIQEVLLLLHNGLSLLFHFTLFEKIRFVFACSSSVLRIRAQEVSLQVPTRIWKHPILVSP